MGCMSWGHQHIVTKQCLEREQDIQDFVWEPHCKWWDFPSILGTDVWMCSPTHWSWKQNRINFLSELEHWSTGLSTQLRYIRNHDNGLSADWIRPWPPWDCCCEMLWTPFRPPFFHGHLVIVDSVWDPIKNFSMATCCGITMTSCELRNWLKARRSKSLGLPPSHAFKLFLCFYVWSEQMFAYVLS